MVADLLHVLLSAAFASSAAVLFVLATRKALRRRFGARAAYSIWAVVPLSMAAALLPAPAASLSIDLMPSSPGDLVFAAISSTQLPTAGRLQAFSWLLGAWLLGALAMFAVFVWQQRRFTRALGRLAAVGDRTLQAQTNSGCPALLGAWQPRVVLPADFQQRYSAAERELILLHEHMHRVRGDAQVNALAAGLRCLFWFNPLIHFAASRFRFDQELACDAVVLARHPGARRHYADAMLKAQLAAFSVPVGCNWQSTHPLKERIALMTRPLPGRARATFGRVLAAVLVAGATYAAWAAQPVALATGANSGRADSPVAAARSADTRAAYRRLGRIAYPPALVAAKIEGTVYVKAQVAADGSVTAASADRVEPQASAALAEAAIAGVKTWTFEPARERGRAVASDEIIPLVFSLGTKTRPVAGGTLDAIRISPP